MVALRRLVLAFLMMMAFGYALVAAILPAPDQSRWRPDDMTTATSAARRLSQDAQALVGVSPTLR